MISDFLFWFSISTVMPGRIYRAYRISKCIGLGKRTVLVVAAFYAFVLHRVCVCVYLTMVYKFIILTRKGDGEKKESRSIRAQIVTHTRHI